MPGASASVRIARLPDVGDGVYRAWVRFPAGWSRPQPGHYDVIEEFIVLEGALELWGHTFAAGSYALIPAFDTREGFMSAAGALVFVRFSGTPRWFEGAAPGATAARATRLVVDDVRRTTPDSERAR